MRFIQLAFPSIFFRPSKKKARRRAPLRGPANDPDLKKIWLELQQEYFPETTDLDAFTVYWSKRKQKRTLASCSLELKRIAVAGELNHPRHRVWLEPLLYHEMCHAALRQGSNKTQSGHRWHGQDFKALERRHPGSRFLDQWIKNGGWLSAVRSHRSRMAHKRRKEATTGTDNSSK